MTLIVTKKSQTPVPNEQYEICTTNIVKDTKGNDVEIPQLVGYYSVADLEIQINLHKIELAKLEGYLAEIEKINTEI